MNYLQKIYTVNHRLKRLIIPEELYDFRDNMVLHQYKTIYFYIPKVACTTLKVTLAELIGLEITRDSVHEMKHMWPSISKKEAVHQYQNYMKFAIVRNPWDRLFAVYSEKIKHDSSINHKYVKNGVEVSLTGYGNTFYAGMPFSEFVEAICNIPDEKANEHFRSQYTFLINRKGQCIVNTIGRFESLRKDIHQIFHKRKIPVTQIPHLNQNFAGKKNYHDAYDQGLQALVAKRYKHDIKNFNYSF